MRLQDRGGAAAQDTVPRGADDGPIEIADYERSWPDSFIAEARRLAPLLPGVRIHHIGSTAVPGLPFPSEPDQPDDARVFLSQ